MSDRKLTSIDFKLEWKSAFATHTDNYFIAKVDLNSDKLPGDLAKELIDLKVGESCSHTYPAIAILEEDYSNDNVIHFDSSLFNQNFKGQNSPPILYRFYPSAIAFEGLKTDPKNYTPFRIISINDENIVADTNHPLAQYYLTLTALKSEEYDYPELNDKRRKNIGKLITSRGPGMQAPFEYGDSVFFNTYPFEAKNKQISPKTNIDSTASEQIKQLYSNLLPKYSKVLELNSDEDSFLSEDLKTGFLAGVGTNETNLSANSRLDTYQVQNLNENTVLSFVDNSFDHAICTLSIETLTNPIAILKEVARIVASGGKLIITFTDNAPASHAILLWGQLHPFERVQLVVEYLRLTGLFTDLNTHTQRGYPRTAEDKKLSDKPISDSVFAIWANVK